MHAAGDNNKGHKRPVNTHTDTNRPSVICGHAPIRPLHARKYSCYTPSSGPPPPPPVRRALLMVLLHFHQTQQSHDSIMHLITGQVWGRRMSVGRGQ